MISMLGSAPFTCRLDVWTLQSLSQFWTPVDFMNPPQVVSIVDIPPLYRRRSHSLTCARVYLYCSTCLPSTRRLVRPLAVPLLSLGAHGRPFIYDMPFSLSLVPATPPQLGRRSSTVADGGYPSVRKISYAGHMAIFDHIHGIRGLLALRQFHSPAGDLMRVLNSEMLRTSRRAVEH
jgi:hypothetical protein